MDDPNLFQFGQDGAGTAVMLRRFDSEASPLSEEAVATFYGYDHQRYPRLAPLVGGNMVLVWTSLGQDGDEDGVFGRVFGSDGTPLTNDIPLSLNSARNQGSVNVAGLPDGGFVATWHSEMDDEGTYRSFLRLFEANGTPM